MQVVVEIWDGTSLPSHLLPAVVAAGVVVVKTIEMLIVARRVQ